MSGDSAETASTPENSPSGFYPSNDSRDHWAALRSNFADSLWFRKVDAILSENMALNSVAPIVARPAELFYNTAMEMFMKCTQFADFLSGLKHRLGTAWDDRLTQPASVFFNTATSAASVVGPGRFVGGAIQLGRSTLNAAVGQLMNRWEQVLSYTEDAVDAWLPERDMMGDDMDDIPDCDDISPKKKRRASDIANKVTRRVKQRIPSWDALKQKLTMGFWFQTVDDILLQNAFIRSLGGVARPAEHFYETALISFEDHKRSLDEFINDLKLRLGAAWDDRLVDPACELYDSAHEISDNDCDINNEGILHDNNNIV